MFKRSSIAGEAMEVACGQCLGCRLDRSREWAARIVHEASLYDDNCFITLTYSPEHLPPGGTLVKSDFQKFMKRLRKRFQDRRIRYYQCGEYGDKLDRPHYHACLFNLDFPDKQLFSEREGNLLFVSEILQKLWPYGFSTVGKLTYQSAAYTARYVLKKMSGQMHDDHYMRVDSDTGEIYWLQPEYTTMSRRPGIGKGWYDKYKTDCFPSDETPVPGEGVFKGVPRYYETLFQGEDPLALEEIKKVRQEFRKAHGDEYSPERLMAKYKCKKAQVARLTRGIEK